MKFIYEFVGSYGVSIILFSLLVKIITSPLQFKQKKSMLATQKLQPKIQAIQKKYYNNKQKMNEEMTALYEREGVSPTAGCGTMLVTLLIIMGLYYVISQPLSYFFQLNADQITSLKDVLKGLGVTIEKSTSQITIAGYIKDNFEALKGISDNLMPVDFHFLGLDLASVPNFKKFDIIWIIPVFSALTAYGQSWLMQKIQERKTGAPMAGNKTMFIMMPLMSLFFGFTLPAGLSLYWVCNNIFGAVSEIIFSMIIDKESVK
jgi:YidC/Oxa1 family membrane protein insertase